MTDPFNLSRQIGLTAIAPEIDLRGRTAVITGAADGIGRAVARACHVFGAHVVAIDVQDDKLKSLESELGGQRITPLSFDMRTTEEGAFRTLTQQVVSASPSGVVDVYLMNAGVIKMNDLARTFFGTAMAEHDALGNINFRSHKVILRELRPYLEQSDAGRVILTSSPIVGRFDPASADYAWSKGALESAVETARVELRAENSKILVTGYVPPPVQNLLRATWKNEPVYANPMPEDVVELPLRLASPALRPEFDGKMLVYLDKREKNVTGHDKDGAEYKYDWNHRNADGTAFDLGIRVRRIGTLPEKDGSTGGDTLAESYDTMNARRLIGAGPVPPFDEKLRLKDWQQGHFGIPAYLQNTLSFGGTGK